MLQNTFAQHLYVVPITYEAEDVCHPYPCHHARHEVEEANANAMRYREDGRYYGREEANVSAFYRGGHTRRVQIDEGVNLHGAEAVKVNRDGGEERHDGVVASRCHGGNGEAEIRGADAEAYPGDGVASRPGDAEVVEESLLDAEGTRGDEAAENHDGEGVANRDDGVEETPCGV
ncbi:hypothetical protein EXIGLDRAFT_770998, partial [Exidia glandulosa HHB12029]